MGVSADDITVVLSGGTANTNQNESLGGDPSNTFLISGNLNNLFSDVGPEEALDGVEDHRCIYIFNDGDETVYQIKIWITSEVDGGADVNVGLAALDELQRIQISNGPVTGGDFKISYESHQITSNYNSNLAEWAQALEDSLNGLDELHDVIVNAQAAGSNTIFDITFALQDGSRNHDAIVVVENNLTGSGSPSVSVSTLQSGTPINTKAPEIDVATTPPGGVLFYAATESAPLELPKLNSGEGFPLWIKRIVAPNTEALNLDEAIIRITMQGLNPYLE